MSIQRYDTADGTQWRVRWREPNGKMRSRTVVNKREALALDADIKARKFKGEALPRPGKETLAVAYDEWWRLHASKLAPSTRDSYRAVWNAHVKGRFDHHRLNELVSDPKLFDELIADMRERGVGNPAQRRVLAVLSGVLSAAVKWNRIPSNPLLGTRKPRATQQRIPRPMPPLVIERIRLQVRGRSSLDPTKARARADACLVTLMAYAGLRPGEALALRWSDVGSRTLAIDKAVSLGEEAPTKTGRTRSVPLATPLAADLGELRKARGDVDDEDLVLPNRSGNHWSRAEYNNWRNRVWTPVMQRLAGGKKPQPRLAEVIPRDMRSSFVSLHLRAGASPLEVARWAGHSAKVMFDHYANVIDELVGKPRIPVDREIWDARTKVATMRREALEDLTARMLDETFTQRQITAGDDAEDEPSAA
jgi:integrase